MTGGGDIWKARGTVATRSILTSGSVSSLPDSLFRCLGGLWAGGTAWLEHPAHAAAGRVVAGRAHLPGVAAGRNPAKALAVPVMTQRFWEQLPGCPTLQAAAAVTSLHIPASLALFLGEVFVAGAGMLLLGVSWHRPQASMGSRRPCGHSLVVPVPAAWEHWEVGGCRCFLSCSLSCTSRVPQQGAEGRAVLCAVLPCVCVLLGAEAFISRQIP